MIIQLAGGTLLEVESAWVACIILGKMSSLGVLMKKNPTVTSDRHDIHRRRTMKKKKKTGLNDGMTSSTRSG